MPRTKKVAEVKEAEVKEVETPVVIDEYIILTKE